MNIRQALYIWGIAVFFVPIAAHAMVISEIYYDPAGADGGHEWIEIYNDEDEPVDITGWKLFENNVNHGIAASHGSMVIPAGEYAVIADNPANVAAAFPNINRLYDSAFSLNNTGELLILKDPELETGDEVSYSAADGAAGTGASINHVGGSWVVRMASPGAAPSTAVPEEDETDDETEPGSDNPSDTAGEDDEPNAQPSQSASGSAKKKEGAREPLYSLSLVLEDTIVANDPVAIEGILKKDVLKLASGRFEWSLGDGRYFATGKLRKFEYVYQVPGNYIVVLEYYKNHFDDVPFLRVQKTIQVLSGTVAIENISAAGTVTFKNTDTKDIDLAGWQMESAGKQFVFGRNTFVIAGSTLAVPGVVHKLLIGSSSSVLLYKPDGARASQFPVPVVLQPALNADAAEAIDTAATSERARIVTHQEASLSRFDVSNRMIWFLSGLLGIMAIVVFAIIYMFRPKKDPALQKETGRQNKSFTDDDIELLT